MTDKEKELMTLSMIADLSTMTDSDIKLWKEACISNNESCRQFVNLVSQAAIYHKQQARG